jgi:hypothetical protein
MILTLFRYARHIIALMIVLGAFGFLFVLLYRKIPVENQQTIQIAAGAILASLAGVIGYYFGSSKDKSDSENSTRQESVTTSLKLSDNSPGAGTEVTEDKTK